MIFALVGNQNCGKSTLFCKIWFALTRNDAFAK